MLEVATNGTSTLQVLLQYFFNNKTKSSTKNQRI